MRHLFRSFFKKKKKLVPLVLCTLVAWRVAFLFSYSDVGEHVSVCVRLWGSRNIDDLRVKKDIDNYELGFYLVL